MNTPHKLYTVSVLHHIR